MAKNKKFIKKPLLPFSVDMKNIDTYRELLIQRPKRSFCFKLSIILAESQPKLLKLLKIAKPRIKIDLQESKISQFWQAIFKEIFQSKILSLSSPKNTSQFKYFKYFRGLLHFNYQLDGKFIPGYHYNTHSHQSIQKKSPLKYLKYCPKIKILEITDRTNDCSFPNPGIKCKRYLRSLEYLALRGKGWGQMNFDFPLEFCEHLRSISFGFYDADFPKIISKFMNALPELSYLQEIDLSIRQNPNFDLIEIFQKIAKMGVLQKVSLELGSGTLSLEKILATLRICELTYFSLKVHFQEGLLYSISELVKNLSHLESHEIHILSRNFSSESDNIIVMCKQINKFPALRRLKLNFETSIEVSDHERISNFIPYLSSLFKKPTKIEVFHIECDQLDPSEALQSLVPILENSAAFLTHLNVNFGVLPCAKKIYQSVLKLMKNLSNIQVFEIPCLDIDDSAGQFLNEMVQALYGYKYLRVFIIGEMNEVATISIFEETVEDIASKRGLRQFRFSMSESLKKQFLQESHIRNIKMKKISKKNPQLDTFDFEKNFSSLAELRYTF